MSQVTIRRWYLVHKWTSVAVTAFLLLLCITGLPLIFHVEIDALTRAPKLEADVRAGAEASLESIVRRARADKPGWATMFLTWEDERPLVDAVIAPSLQAEESDVKVIAFDRRTGARVTAPPPNEGFMSWLLELHSGLLMGLPGEMLLGLVGLVFMVSLISGVVVYAPFMRRLAFGTVRKRRSARVKWLDTHNLVGIALTGWLASVGFTGFVITMSQPITLLWQANELSELAAPYEGKAPPNELVSVDRVLAAVRGKVPVANISFIAWPGTQFSTPHHYMVALKGDTPLTKRLIKVAMVDARTAEVNDVRETPWYVKAVFLSVPLHFGDYGGLPLKIIWALLDLGAIVVLATGLYLWLGRRHASIERRLAELASGGAAGVEA
jgi:uncharacterized iron-regulated membrane protein